MTSKVTSREFTYALKRCFRLEIMSSAPTIVPGPKRCKDTLDMTLLPCSLAKLLLNFLVIVVLFSN